MVAPYPPGIPVVAPGEEVSDEIAAYLGEAAARALHVHGPEDLTLKTLRVVS
jgi:lysine decarboxylase